MVDYQALATELTTDALTIGYAGKSDVETAVLLNAPRVGQILERDVIPSWEVIEATVPAEWATLTAAEKQRYQTIVGAGQISVRGANTRAAFAAMFGAGTTTRANLLALQTRVASRAEKLLGQAASHVDVAIARGRS